MKKPRAVKIELRGDTWFVLYMKRRWKQHHAAATFYAKDHTHEAVERWVKTQPHLTLL